jgi:negative regulator of flagellin synthesis FlgM
MPQKINNLPTSVTSGRASSSVATVKDPVAGATVASETTESGEVHITDTATHLAALEQTLRDSPAVDSARVALLRNAIEQGQYSVDSNHVATQLLQVEHALSGLTNARASAPVAPDEF